QLAEVLQAVPAPPIRDLDVLFAVGVGLALRLRRDGPPPAGQPTENSSVAPVLSGIGQRGRQGRQTARVRSGQRFGQRGQVVLGEEGGVGLARQERRVSQHPDEQVAVGGQAVDRKSTRLNS